MSAPRESAELRFESMASSSLLVACGQDRARLSKALEEGRRAVESVATSCNRFDPDSALSRLNELGSCRCAPPALLAALAAAADAHERTKGAFDPRILCDLERLGYDRSFEELPEELGAVSNSRGLLGCWSPTIDVNSGVASLDGWPVDLGGIAKGLAADLALEALRSRALDGLVDLGGDGAVSGCSPDREPWRVGIEDPAGDPDPLAVFEIDEGGYATSSIRLRRWRGPEGVRHHLIDPRSGLPGGEGMASVTVISSSARRAEVDAKVAFLAGGDAIELHCLERGLRAFWVRSDGSRGATPLMRDHLVWEAA